MDKTTYKGFLITDVTTQTDDGRYKARAAIVSLDGTRTRSQRFIDLATFRTPFEAEAQVLAAAMAWIDAAAEEDRLSLPSNFLPFSTQDKGRHNGDTVPGHLA